MPRLSEQLVLKEGGVFLVADQAGDMRGESAHGLYYRDMRFLSHFTFEVNHEQPELLNYSSSLNFLGTLQFANRFSRLDDGTLVLPQTISISRARFIAEGLHERLSLTNYNPFPVPLTITLTFGADFRDLFDVRGFPREKWGKRTPPVLEDGVLSLGYEGLDQVTRQTLITFDRLPDAVLVTIPEHDEPLLEPGLVLSGIGEPAHDVVLPTPLAALSWTFVLEQNAPISLTLHVSPRSSHEEAAGTPEGGLSPAARQVDGRFDNAIKAMHGSYAAWESEVTAVSTNHDHFNSLLERSKYDLRVLCEVDGEGYFPAAGIPWFTCPFGRDSLITALQTLMFNPAIAIGTLRTLARHQGRREDPWREEQPGKILHELRRGEMANLNLVPHSPYFGSVDATPLFVILFVETMRWLDDDRLFEELLPSVHRAVEWIDRYGDVDGDGFVEYVAAPHASGIRNQVWKDSGDSIQFPDRTLAETPIAAVEVQGYVYAAKQGLAELLRRKGDPAAAERLAGEAETLKRRFNQAFWMPESGFFAQGLDRDKRQVPTVTSNPGHCLWTGIVDEDKAALTVERMTRPDMLSGWGLRTIGEQSSSYNPMSYHNGSIWPHDNSLVIAGFKRYGFHDAANRVITEILEAAQHFQYARLPELYCGFRRDRAYMTGPAEYPVSCSPQAWAAAAPMLMLQAMLGLQPDAPGRGIRMNPRLPDWLSRVELRNLRLGDERVALVVERGERGHQVTTSGSGSGVHVAAGTG